MERPCQEKDIPVVFQDRSRASKKVGILKARADVIYEYAS